MDPKDHENQSHTQRSLINRTWDHMKSYNPHTFSSRKFTTHGTTAALMKHCLEWQWLHEVLVPGYSLWDPLTKFSKKTPQRNWTVASRMRMGEEKKKNDDCPLSKTVKAPHFYRRRNLVLLAHFQPQNAHHASNLCSVIL